MPLPSHNDGREVPHRAQQLRQAIEHAGHLLPAQGPIGVFVHHNTLHAFEDLAFDEGVQRGAEIFGCQAYLSEDRFRQELDRGRISSVDLERVLRRDLGAGGGETVAHLCTRHDLRLAMLKHPLRRAASAELRWFVAETDALARYRQDASPSVRQRFLAEVRHWAMRDLRPNGSRKSPSDHPPKHRGDPGFHDLVAQFGESSMDRWDDHAWEAFALQALWRTCREGVHGVKADAAPKRPPRRHRDLLRDATGEDSDALVNELLIRFTAAFLDQGFAPWPVPDREMGYFHSFCQVYGEPGGSPEAWLAGLQQELARQREQGLDALASIFDSLEQLGVEPAEWDEFITQTFLSLRGWGGMIRQVEQRGDRAVHPAPPGSLEEFLAVRLILERLALTHLARTQLGFQGPLRELRAQARKAARKPPAMGVEQRAFEVFQLAQLFGWLPERLSQLSKPDWTALVAEIAVFSGLHRRRLFQMAFDRHYRRQTLDALAVRSARSPYRAANPAFQAIFCIDEREESMRRHLEEVAPEAETFGAAGFFSVAMYYRGAADAHYVPLCPIVIRPRHWVAEAVALTHAQTHAWRARTRKALGTVLHRFHLGSRTFAGGAVLTAGVGVLASIPLVMRVLFPRSTARVRKAASRLFQPPPATRLQLDRSADQPGPADAELGFSVEERIGIGERLLRDIGLTEGFARLVMVLGHGSSSLNNPHKSAYDCGACGGGAGGPNARAAAQILNDPRVRAGLAERGLAIPHATVFVGGFHNTCNDGVTFFDLDRLPPSHHQEFLAAERAIEDACDRNAHERCRRFQSAALSLTFPAARRHVEARSEDLAQTRPECGHATNAICFVGRRSRTRGLYMDRRCFLVSYDPTQDDEQAAILTRILQAVVPVCAGINLEYYFSYVDPSGWGCGTKLPHNVTSLLGIMDGAISDLRPGLPWQMVEIHEPVRLMFVCESTPAALARIMEANEGIRKLIQNGWVQLAVLDPDSGALEVFHRDHFERYEPDSRELPEVESSVDWYRGWREHLGFAMVRRSLSQPTAEDRQP